MDGVEKRTYRAFSLVVCRYRSRPSFSTQLLRRTHFRERAEEAVWWRRGQDGGAFEDSERLGPSPQVNSGPEPGRRRRVADVAFTLRKAMLDPGYPYGLPHQLKDEGEAWLSCHPPGKPTLYGSLTCQGIGLDGIPEVTASEGFIVNEINKPYKEVQKILIIEDIFIVQQNFQKLSSTIAEEITEKHSYFMSKGNCIFEVFGTIYYFFQNSYKECLVVLSGGMDAQLKIWSAEDASCVVTFKGHKGGILDTAIVDRGRNVVSGSRDGTARLWDCGRSACLGVIADCGSSINGVAVGAADNSINLGSPEQMPSEREVGTELKMLLLAREDKKLQCFGLQSRQPASGSSKIFELWGNLAFLAPACSQVFLFIGSDAFNCCTFLSGFLLLAGTQDGNIYQLDVRSPRAPVQVIHRSGAPVLSLLSFRDGFIASQGDGSCFIVQQDLDYVIELTGADSDPVYKVATWEKQIYTCCRDGLVRRYQLSDL
ncbi:Proteasomal ATPase-associated factor 1 [Camelus dromedarius]|uniref:Proteasomal ATPase-associated factor 1 n=1 Tax=Camelus dromedarius TaxID=9838 RepID=A0A5N4DM44_CAMDR|nr:Proteasomal ATPase-associated factor 1 [Camelus dromedarius]KAB1272227.1 Proteasomal ATPase-associated factor 1 [Camelus dromedarius]